MALTQHLRGSLGEWLVRHCPAVRAAADQLSAAVRQSSPVAPPAGADRAHLAAVGGAVDARLALAVDQAPPYGALLGAVRAGVVSLSAAGRHACTWPTHKAVPSEDAAAGVWLRVLPSQKWAVFGDVPAESGPPMPAALQGLLEELRDRAAAVSPGAVGTTDQEQRLAELCLVVSELEAAYRSGSVGPSAAAVLAGKPVPDSPARRDDVAGIIRHNADTLQRARQRAGAAVLGTSAPILLPQWAEGDLILGRRGGEQTLVDVKTSLAGGRQERAGEWLRQVVAYALLDGRDAWQIRRVGLWLARSGRIYSWPLGELTSDLGEAQVGEFRRLALSAYHADGG